MKRLDLSHYLDNFQKAINARITEWAVSQAEVARRANVDPPLLNMLLSGARKLSAYYLMFFISKGIIKVDEIYDGNAKTEKESDFWKAASLAENHELLSFLSKIQEKKGVDVLEVLKQLYPDIK